MISLAATLLFPFAIIAINAALYHTERQSSLIQQMTYKTHDAEYWRGEYQNSTKARAILNLLLGFFTLMTYCIFLQERFLMVCSVTLLGHTVYYLYLVFQYNAEFLRRLE